MYYVLERELRLKGITRKQLAEIIGVSPSTINCKLKGASEFSLKEVCEIRKHLGFEGTVEELFETDYKVSNKV